MVHVKAMLGAITKMTHGTCKGNAGCYIKQRRPMVHVKAMLGAITKMTHGTCKGNAGC